MHLPQLTLLFSSYFLPCLVFLDSSLCKLMYFSYSAAAKRVATPAQENGRRFLERSMWRHYLQQTKNTQPASEQRQEVCFFCVFVLQLFFKCIFLQAQFAGSEFGMKQTFKVSAAVFAWGSPLAANSRLDSFNLNLVLKQTSNTSDCPSNNFI